MCGRYTANTEDEVIEIRSILAGLTMRLASDSLDRENLYGKEIFPSNAAPVITCNGDLILSKFGFDKWDDSGLIINARSETIDTSRFFSPYTKKGRCIIPASHYFEWKKSPSSRSEKYKLGSGNKSGIFMAGLLNQTAGKESFVILTKSADENISFIHERMPVMLTQFQLLPWLDGSLDISSISSVSVNNISFEKAV